MGNRAWIGFTATRYISGRRRDKTSPSSVLAVLGIGVGVLALIVILAVMNGFQLGFIESILEISSYHVRADGIPDTGDSGPLLAEIRGLGPVRSAVPFREIQGLIRGDRGNPQVSVIRGLPPDALDLDRGMAEKLIFESGSFDLTKENSVLIGAELARRLGVRLGDEIHLMSVSGLTAEDAEAGNSLFTITGIFRSGFYEYDLGWGFINIDEAAALQGTVTGLSLGIKLHNRWQDDRVLGMVQRLNLPEGTKVSSWREYNRAFFGALRTEKLLMFVLVGLIFIVVGLNIYQSQRRSVLERREEIGLLRAVGASERAVRMVFACDGLIIGTVGALSGMALGLLVAFNIGPFFSFLENIVNSIIHLLNVIAAPFTGGFGIGGEDFSIFSPAVFYIKEIPSRVIPYEVCIICAFGILSATVAAWLASGRVTRIRPAEVLRYE
ncbi:ABC transporter permease [Breznakiella homolactica]|uniref:ABC transporter permease n=1 Tax=Breznakiella homolactica TaxID=2798577 RepID=A0A7T8BAJ5_9SPIR|nr:ABC transporter permease [Breznakiella homolactica]QQO08283.1 ABC transporter permease [Breznakiella homolactica]